jgi:hypothetical protein
LSVTQMKGVLLNMFFGVTLNSAEGISSTASAQVNMFSVSMTRAINPQLVKSEGSGDSNRMLRITEISTKYSVFLFALFAIPILLEAPYLLKIWLKNIPTYAVVFCQLSLIGMMIEKFTFPITDAIRAIGNIRNFQVTETIILLLNIPFTYTAFKLGYSPVAIYIIIILISSVLFFNRLYFGKVIANLNIPSYFRNAIFPVLIPILFAVLLAIGIHFYLPEGFFRLCSVSLLFASSLLISFWNFGLHPEEKHRLKTILLTAYRMMKKQTIKRY